MPDYRCNTLRMPDVNLCVYCGTNVGNRDAYLRAAVELGTAMAANDIGLIYGGGRLGLMGAIADAVLAGGGHVTGVIPDSLVRVELAHQGLTRLEIVDSMHTRKARMADLATGFVAMAGGFGTFEELLEVLTWNQLGLIHKAVVVFDIDDFYAPLLQMFASAVSAGFVRPEHVAMAQRATTVADVIALATAAAPTVAHKWIDRDLVALRFADVSEFPEHPDGLEWPTHHWPLGEVEFGVDAGTLRDALELIAATDGEGGVSLATLVIHHGRIVAEQYGPETDAATTLISWSTAKSITQAVFGILVGDGLVDIDARAAVPEFEGTAKAAITVRDLLGMRSGLQFVEDYVDDSVSHCLEMLFGGGKDDHAHYAASQDLIHRPGTVWSYSSGTTNILSRLAGTLVSGAARPGRGGIDESDEAAMRDFLDRRLFRPLGMTSATPRFDAAGTFVGSSYVYATARDFARFGYLYLRDGVWEGTRLLPEGWVGYARTAIAVDEDPPHFGYGAHWWTWPDQPGSVAAHGYEGQYIVVVPDRDLVVVQLGKVPADVRPPLLAQLRRVINAFPVNG